MTTQSVLIAVFVLLALPILWALIRFATWLMSNPFSRPAPRDEFQHSNCRCSFETTPTNTAEYLSADKFSTDLALRLSGGDNEWSEIGKRIQANLDTNPDFYLTDGQQ